MRLLVAAVVYVCASMGPTVVKAAHSVVCVATGHLMLRGQPFSRTTAKHAERPKRTDYGNLTGAAVGD